MGDACAHLLASSGIARSLVLANRTIDNAEAVRMDLEQSRSWSTPLSARAVVPWRKGAFSGGGLPGKLADLRKARKALLKQHPELEAVA